MAGSYSRATDASPNPPQLLITNDSPLVAYFPLVIDTLGLSPNLSAGWSLFYNNTIATNANELGQGLSYHATSCPGASFLIQWNGTAVDLLGHVVGDASYYLTLDGVLLNSTSSPNSASGDGLLASLSGLANTNHTLVLTNNESSSVDDVLIQFDGALVSYDPPTGVSNSTVNSAIMNDTDIFFTGGWTLVDADNDTYGGVSMHISQNSGDSAVLSFTGSAVSVYGLVSSSSGAYSAILDGMLIPPSLPTPTSSQGLLSNSTSQNPLSASPVTNTASARNLTATSTFTNSDALLFFASGLDQTVTHTLVLENDANTTLGIRVGGVNVSAFGDVTAGGGTTYLSEPSTSKSTPPGTIAAAVLASALTVLIAAIILWYFFVYRPRRRACRRAALHQGSQHGRDPEAAEGVLDIGSSHTGGIGPGTRESGFAGVVLPGEADGKVNRSKESSLSSSKGYGIGLGLRRGWFGLRRGDGSSTSGSVSTRSAGPSQPRRSVPGPRHSLAGALGLGEDDRRFSAGTLQGDAPPSPYPKAPVRALESEKLAPGWHNPYEPPRRSHGGFGMFQSLGALYGPPAGWVGDEKEKEIPEEGEGVKEAGEHEDKKDLDWDDGDDTATLAEDLLATLSLQPRYSEAIDLQPQAKDKKEGASDEKQRHAYARPDYSSRAAVDGDGDGNRRPDRRTRRSLLPLPLRAHSPFHVDVASIIRPSREKRESGSTGSGSAQSTNDRQEGKGKAKAKSKSKSKPSVPPTSIGRSFLDFSASIIGTSLSSHSGTPDPSVRRSKGASTGSEAGTQRRSKIRESHLTAATQDTHGTQGSDAEVPASVSSARADNGHESRSQTRSPSRGFDPSSRRQSLGTVLDISRDAMQAADSARQGGENDEGRDAWTPGPLAELERLVRTVSGRQDVAPIPDAPASISPETPETSPSQGSRPVSGTPSHTRSRNESGSGSSHPQTHLTRSSSSPFPFPVTIPSSSQYDHLSNTPHSVGDEAEDEMLHFQHRDGPSPPPLPHPLRINVPPPPTSPSQNLSAPSIPFSPEQPQISPTSSVPFSVSDIHFRHSGSSWGPGADSRRVSALSGFSNISRPGGRRVSGNAQATPVYTPPPPYIVQRVLGMTAPPTGATHGRSSSQSQPQSQSQSQSQPRTPMSPPYLAAHSRGSSVTAHAPSRSTSFAASAALQSPPAAATPMPSPGFVPSSTTSSTFRFGSLLGPRPRPSRPPTADSVFQQQQQQAGPQREDLRRGPR